MKKYSTVARIDFNGIGYHLYDINTNAEIKENVSAQTVRRGYNRGYYVAKFINADGTSYWGQLNPTNINTGKVNKVKVLKEKDVVAKDKKSISEILEKVNSYISSTDDTPKELVSEVIVRAQELLPNTLVISPLNWKLAVHGVLRSNNIMLLGNSGCGKTLTASTIAKVFNRPFFRFNMGAMQDARSSLIGNTHYKAESGTFFAGSEFITAISTPGAIVYLDEYTRISSDAENIMLTVLDKDQRYIRIDEAADTPTINVAPGVVFIATANIGVEYTSTRILDRATTDRWSTIVELSLLSKEQEINLMKLLFPDLLGSYIIAFADVADYTRNNVKSESPTLSTIISTRSLHEQCALALDGFRFTEVMEALVFQLFSSEGGVDSERTEIRQMAQNLSNLDSICPITGESSMVIEDVIAESTSDDELLFDESADTIRPF